MFLPILESDGLFLLLLSGRSSFSKKKKKLIYLHWVFVVARGIFNFHCSSGIFTHSTWDLVPLAGIKPGPPALGLQSLSHWTTREVPVGIFSESWILLLVMYMILGCLSTALTVSFKAQTFHSEASKSPVQLLYPSATGNSTPRGDLGVGGLSLRFSLGHTWDHVARKAALSFPSRQCWSLGRGDEWPPGVHRESSPHPRTSLALEGRRVTRQHRSF